MKINYKRITIKLFLLIVTLFIIGFYFDLRASFIKFHSLNAKEQALKIQLNNENNLLRQKKNIIEQLQKFHPSLPNEKKPSAIIGYILKIGQENGLIIHQIHPVPTQANLGIKSFLIFVKAEGSFLQFVKFTSCLNEFYLPILLGDFSVNTLANGGIEINMQLKSFNRETKFQSAQIPINFLTTSPNPFIALGQKNFLLSNEMIDIKKSLKFIPLDQIKFVGYIKTTLSMWFLVMMPNGQTIEVNEHDKIGTGKAQIVGFDESGVFLLLDGFKEHRNFG